MNVAVIPARGGSERIPRKNVRPFLGVPVIGYPLRTALRSGLFDRVLVSTDDQEIADLARALGGEVPFHRPAELADNQTSTVEVLGHAVDWMFERSWPVRNVCCIYPTSVFTLPQDLSSALRALGSQPSGYVVSAGAFPASLERAFGIGDSGRMKMLRPDFSQARTQDLETTYHDAAHFYWGHVAAWQNRRPVLWNDSRAIVIPRRRVQDIDTEDDWFVAECMYRALAERGEMEPMP